MIRLMFLYHPIDLFLFKIQEGVRNNYMVYDPFWCCWKPKINKKEFSDALSKLTASETAKMKESANAAASFSNPPAVSTTTNSIVSNTAPSVVGKPVNKT